MKLTKTHFIFFAICSFLSVFTTVGIHSGIFDFEFSVFTEEIQLYQNTTYNFGKCWVIGHCLLVLLGMWGVFLIQFRKSLPFFGLGILFYTIFAITEIYRQFLYLFYLNGQYQRYQMAESMELRGRIMHEIHSFDLTSYALFALFILAFALGNLAYGLGFIRGTTWWDKALGAILLLWALQGLATLGNEFWKTLWMDRLNENFGLVFQPLARFAIGYWFISKLPMKKALKSPNDPKTMTPNV